MVGAPGFEPGASCAQDRLTISCKSRIFKHSIANTNLSFVRDMWLDVPGCISLIAGYYKSHYSYCLERELRHETHGAHSIDQCAHPGREERKQGYEAWRNHAVYSKNRERLLNEEIAESFFQRVLERAKPYMSDEHFTVDGTLIEAWASHNSFRPKDRSGKPPGAGGDVDFREKSERTRPMNRRVTASAAARPLEACPLRAKGCRGMNPPQPNQRPSAPT